MPELPAPLGEFFVIVRSNQLGVEKAGILSFATTPQQRLCPAFCQLEAWLNRTVPVLFDHQALAGFHEGKPAENSRLWCLLAGRVRGHAIAAIVPRKQFSEIARQRAEGFPVKQIMQLLDEGLSPRPNPAPPSAPPPHRPMRRRYARF